MPKPSKQILEVLDKAVNYASVLSDDRLRMTVVIALLKQYAGVKLTYWHEKIVLKREGGGPHHVNEDGECSCVAGEYRNSCWAVKVVSKLGFESLEGVLRK